MSGSLHAPTNSDFVASHPGKSVDTMPCMLRTKVLLYLGRLLDDLGGVLICGGCK